MTRKLNVSFMVRLGMMPSGVLYVFYFRNFESGDVSILYVMLFALASTTFGLLSYRAKWVQMVAT